jgi:hypothetical protein
MKSGILFLSVLVVMIAGCTRPHLTDAIESTGVPITFTTSLRDSIPANTFHLLNIENINGVRLLDLDGADIRYFRYEVNTEKLLHALSLSPFSIDAISADTVCRKLDGKKLSVEHFKQSELSYAAPFINANDSYEIYESIKPPLRHLVLINKNKDLVLHRISNI